MTLCECAAERAAMIEYVGAGTTREDAEEMAMDEWRELGPWCDECEGCER